MSKIKRRQFLYVAGSAGLAGVIGAATRYLRNGNGSVGDVIHSSLATIDMPAASRWSWVKKARMALGSHVVITAIHRERTVAELAIENAFREIDVVEGVLSIYQRNSQVTRLNRDQQLSGAHPYLLEVLSAARKWSELTEGAFDVTVQPLWNLYSSAKRRDTIPTDSEVAEACKRVDWRRVQLNEDRVEFQHSDPSLPMAITLNGIAQGFAADRVVHVLRAMGIEHALVDSGETAPLGVKPEEDGAWRIGIQHPREPDSFASVVRLEGRCLATSGDYATTFSLPTDTNRRHHHIFDPSTGRSPIEFSSVSVVAKTAMDADAMSTAIFVLGLERGRRLVESVDGADALFVMKDGSSFSTDGFPS